MDELSLLRRARTDIAERAPEEVARGRAALVAAMEGESPIANGTRGPVVTAPSRTPRRRRRAAAWTGFSVVGATAVVTSIVAVNVVGIPGVHTGADPAAASVLESAALAALQFSDPVVAPGQFLRVQTDGVFLAQGQVDAESEHTSFLESYHDELYVPADRGDDWIWVRCMRSPVETFGPESEAFAKKIVEMRSAHDGDVWRSFPGGNTPGGPFVGYDDGTGGDIVDHTALPREPELLLQMLYKMYEPAPFDTQAVPETQVLDWVISTLMRGTVPAEFRAVLYETAALIPGVTITEDQATLSGATGVAIGRGGPESQTRREFIIDPATGQFLGEREMVLVGWPGVPADTVWAWTAVTTTVVDAAPTGAALCADYR